jgi:hypothetical protein
MAAPAPAPPAPVDIRDEHLNALWALLTRANRAVFYQRLLTSPNNEYFTEDVDDSPRGRLWGVALSAAYAPIANEPLAPKTINNLGLAPAARTGFRDLIISILRGYLTELHIPIPNEPAHGGGRRRRHRSHRNRRRKVHRRHRNTRRRY